KAMATVMQISATPVLSHLRMAAAVRRRDASIKRGDDGRVPLTRPVRAGAHHHAVDSLAVAHEPAHVVAGVPEDGAMLDEHDAGGDAEQDPVQPLDDAARDPPA